MILPYSGTMALKRQYCMHWPQPMHRPVSMRATPDSSRAMAGQPKVAQEPQAVQEAFTQKGLAGLRSSGTR